MSQTITLTFNYSGTPINGFIVKYREVGSGVYSQVLPNPTSSPVNIVVDDYKSWEGTIAADCGINTSVTVPWAIDGTSKLLRIENNVSDPSDIISSVFGDYSFFASDPNAFPVEQGEHWDVMHLSYSGDLWVNVSNISSNDLALVLYINNTQIDVITNITGSNIDYKFESVSFSDSDSVRISLIDNPS